MEQGALERIKSFNIQCMSQTQVNWIVEQLPKLLEHVDSQASQIAALKEIASQQRAELLYVSNKNPKEKFQSLKFEYPDKRKTYTDEARKQLEAEYPEAMR